VDVKWHYRKSDYPRLPAAGGAGIIVHFPLEAVTATSDPRNVNDPIPYREAFPVGTAVRVADRSSLEAFMSSWRYHHKLQPEQLAYADQLTTVEKIGFYHGGDSVCTLTGIPGVWLEQCLRPAESGPVG